MALLPPGLHDTHGWDWGQFAQRPWMLWTATLFDPARGPWCANLGLLVLLAICGDCLGAGRREALCLWLAWPLATYGLHWWPQLTGPVGLSGATHAAGAILIVRALAEHRLLACAAAAGLALKLAVEHAWATPRAFSPHWDASVLYALHLSGALAGALLGLLLARRAPARRRPHAPPPASAEPSRN
jgi:membrane associated rhomboid family serine protease